jgi:hypothetical protein
MSQPDDAFRNHPLHHMTPARWSFLALAVIVFIEGVMILGLIGKESGTNIGPYRDICNSNVYDNSVGYTRTAYYPCTNDIP